MGKDLKIPYRPAVAIPITLNFKLPILFSRSRTNDDEIERVKAFFDQEKGSIAISQATCSTHWVDLSWNGPKVLTQTFIEAVKGLHMASNQSNLKQNLEFRRFINEFGTHYAKRTILGVRLYSERRYSMEESENLNDEDMKNCNTAMAIKLLGMQVDPNVDTCHVPSIFFKNFTSHQLQKYMITTSGSYALKNGTEWSQQVLEMHKNGILYPVPIKRKLRPIVELFFDKRLQVNITFFTSCNPVFKWIKYISGKWHY